MTTNEDKTLPSSERPEAAPSTDRGGHGAITATQETLQSFVEQVRGVVKEEVRAEVRAAVKEEMEPHAAEEIKHHRKVEATMRQTLLHVRHALDRLGRLEVRIDEHDKRLIRLEHPDIDFDAETDPPEPSGGG